MTDKGFSHGRHLLEVHTKSIYQNVIKLSSPPPALVWTGTSRTADMSSVIVPIWGNGRGGERRRNMYPLSTHEEFKLWMENASTYDLKKSQGMYEWYLGYLIQLHKEHQIEYKKQEEEIVEQMARVRDIKALIYSTHVSDENVAFETAGDR